AVTVADYSFLATVATPTITPNGGTFASSQSVTLSCATSGATIYYTLDGTDPNVTSPAYSTAITLTAGGVGKARAIKAGLSPSPIVSATFTQSTTVSTPRLSPPGIASFASRDVQVTCDTAGADIHYTLDGTVPTQASTQIISGTTVRIWSNKTLKVKAWKSGLT